MPRFDALSDLHVEAVYRSDGKPNDDDGAGEIAEAKKLFSLCSSVLFLISIFLFFFFVSHAISAARLNMCRSP